MIIRCRLRSSLVVAALAVIMADELGPQVASAHPLAPSLLRLSVIEDGQVEVLWRTPAVRPVGEELTPRLPVQCRPLIEPRVTLSSDRSAVEHRWRADCGESGLVDSVVSVGGLSTASTNVVIEVEQSGGSSSRGLLHRGQERFVIPRAQGGGEVFVDYLRLGVEHLLTGPDHVLFVLGLLLLLRSMKPLVQAITSFTVGHSVSLALAVLGVVQLPQWPIEVAIAASLIVLALDIVRERKEMSPGPVSRWPWAVCAAFGLLHGLGFAGALAHTGLPEQAIPLSLFAFNLGIEAGQLLIVVLAFLIWRVLLKRVSPKLERYHQVPAYTIGSLAAFWVIERTLGGLGVM